MQLFKIVGNKTGLSERVPSINERNETHATDKGIVEVKNEPFSESIVQSWRGDSW
jgi:hypothetical protein